MRETIFMLDSLGFTIHPEKSVTIPTQQLSYLGFLLNSLDMTITLTQERILKIQMACKEIFHRTVCTIRELAQVVGSLVAAEPAFELAPVFYKRTEIQKSNLLQLHKGNFEAKVKVTDTMKEDLKWWIDNVHLVKRQIHPPKHSVEIYSDSSDFAWGGVRDSSSTGGPWSDTEKRWHINVKETLAAFLTLQTFCDQESNVHIRLNLDNTTAVAYINAKGGKKADLNDITRKIWLWALERDIWLSAVHVPGVNNTEADRASRRQHATETEWKLAPMVYEQLNQKFGPFEIDLFASRLNNQCKKYFAWHPDPGAMAIDALAHEWPDSKLYAFPPFSLIGRILE